MTPMSTERMSPRFSLYGPGIPCTTIEFGDAQIEPGKPRYPLKAGSALCERMNRSAAPSSSPVVTPGRALEERISWQRARMRPGAAMLSISSGVLRWITVLDLCLEREGCQCGTNPAVHLVRRHRPVEPAQQPALVGRLDEHRRRERAAPVLERALEHLGLGDRARKAVEQEAVVGVARVEPVRDHPADEVVGHELALL